MPTFQRSSEIASVSDKAMKKVALVSHKVASYGEPSSRYHEETAQAKGKELMTKMKKDLFSVYLEFLGKLRTQALDNFDKAVEAAIPTDENEILANFASVMAGLRQEALDTFETKSKGAIIDQAVDEWSGENDFAELQSSIERHIAAARDGQLRRMVDKLEKNIKIKIVEPLQDVLESPTEEMWTLIREIEAGGQKKTSEMLERELTSFACSEEEIAKKVSDLNRRVRVTMIETIKKHVNELYDHIMKLFTSKFQYDQGLPRKWTKEMNVEELYTQCKEEVLSVIELFGINRLDVDHDELTYKDDVPAELVLLSQREASQLKKRFTQTSDALFTAARTEQERNSTATQTPAFMVVLLLIFAFDEILWILSNPMLFMLALCICAVFTFLWYFDLLYLVKPVFNTVLRTSVSNVHNILTTVNAEVPKEKSE